MDPDLRRVLKDGRLNAHDILAFLEGPNAPKDWKEAWKISDRIGHLAQDPVWCAAVAERSQMGQMPSSPELARLLAHAERMTIHSARGTIGTADYWGDVGKALLLRPAGTALELVLGADGSAKARLSASGRKIERTSRNPAAAICWVVLCHLAQADPYGASLQEAKGEDRTFVLEEETGLRPAA